MRYFYIVLFILSVHVAQAQKLQVGPVGSVFLAQPVFDNVEIAENNRGIWAPGGGIGISTNFIANDVFSLSTELLYYHQRKSVEGNDGVTFFQETHDFIKLPISFQYAHPVGYSKVHVFVGPVANYWISGRGEALVPELVEDDLEGALRYVIAYDGIPKNDRFVVSDPNRWQLGIQIGAGATFPVQQNHLKVDARFEWGHTNMARPGSTYSPFVFYDISLDHTFHTFSLSCAYLFSFDLFKITHKGKSTNKKNH
ncbi:MAG: outer membrane beta-barrel protein [Bacteroidota bacterium]